MPPATKVLLNGWLAVSSDGDEIRPKKGVATRSRTSRMPADAMGVGSMVEADTEDAEDAVDRPRAAKASQVDKLS